MSGLEWFKSID